MSDADKAAQATKDATNKRKLENLAKVSAWMTNDPEGFDRHMAKLAEDPEVVKQFAEAGLFPVEMSPEQRELADKMLAEMEQQELAKAKKAAPK